MQKPRLIFRLQGSFTKERFAVFVIGILVFGFDSGATYSCIKRELVEKLGVIEILPEPIEFENGKGRGKCRGERAHESNLLS